MTFQYAVNCSILFTELPLEQRAAAARKAGFGAVEFWWPWPVAVPSDREVEAFVGSVADAGVQHVALNLYAGDMPGGERGIAAHPARAAEFRDNLDVLVEIARRTGCRQFNALYGNRLDDVPVAEQDAVAEENLALAARAVAGIGGTILIETISGTPAFPWKTAAETVGVVERLRAKGADNVAFLYDAYHLAANGDDALAALAAHYDVIGHVQLADNPGRHEPGTGELDIPGILAALTQRGWSRFVALEYKPATTTEASFDWLPFDERGAR